MRGHHVPCGNLRGGVDLLAENNGEFVVHLGLEPLLGESRVTPILEKGVRRLNLRADTLE